MTMMPLKIPTSFIYKTLFQIKIGWLAPGFLLVELQNPQGVTLSLKWLSKIGSKDYNLLLVELGLVLSVRPCVRPINNCSNGLVCYKIDTLVCACLLTPPQITPYPYKIGQLYQCYNRFLSNIVPSGHSENLILRGVMMIMEGVV